MISGTIRAVMDDGQTLDIGPDSVFEIPPGHDKWVVGDEPWVTLDWGASGRAIIAALDETGTRTLGTVLFTDIVDSTRRAQEIGDEAWRHLLARHNEDMRVALNVHRGREIKTTGDGFLALFDSPTRAALCAAEMLRSSSAIGLAIRVGVHTGEVEVTDNDVRGIAVHTAARILGARGSGRGPVLDVRGRAGRRTGAVLRGRRVARAQGPGRGPPGLAPRHRGADALIAGPPRDPAAPTPRSGLAAGCVAGRRSRPRAARSAPARAARAAARSGRPAPSG